MRSFPAQIIAVLILLFCISCSVQSDDREFSDDIINNPAFGVWQENAIPPFQFELEQTFGNNKDIMLPQIYQLQGPVADNEGNVYVIDGQNGVLYSFDSGGELRWKTGQEGKGPGDFQRPQGLITDGEFLYTGNVNGSRIDQLYLEGNLKNSISLEGLDISFTTVEGFISDSLLITSSGLMAKAGILISVLNKADDFKKIHQFEFSNSEINILQGFSFFLDVEITDSVVVFGNIKDYANHFYNISGEKIKIFRRNFDKLMRPGIFKEGSHQTMRSYGNLSAPIYHPQGFYLVTLSWPTNVDDPDQFLKRSRNEDSDVTDVTYENSLDFYNTEGRLLYSIEHQNHMPEIGTISYIDKHGKVYTKTNEPYPQIRRYNLTMNFPS